MSDYTEVPELGIENSETKTSLLLENIKCGGCANTITKSLNELSIEGVEVDHEIGKVKFNHPANDEQLLSAINKLHSLGYPIIDTEEGLTAFALKAKSYTSCAIGKLS